MEDSGAETPEPEEPDAVTGPGPPAAAGYAPVAFPTATRICMAVSYGRAGCLDSGRTSAAPVALSGAAAVGAGATVGLGRIVALYYRSSALYQIH